MKRPTDIHSLLSRHQSSGRALLYSVIAGEEVEAYADGAWIETQSGKRYLDWGSYAVMLLGHRHPAVVNAVAAQLQRIPISCRAFPTEIVVTAAAKLAALAPPPLSKVMFLSSGTEIVEAAIKLARAVTRRSGLVRVERGYHGKTFGALSLTDAELFREPFEPLLGGVSLVRRDDCESAARHIREVEPAAVIIEPVQGEGGIHEFSAEYLMALREACDAVGAVLICDEIQCGLGRCGALWMCAEKGVTPDILLTGKALGGGVVPVSAMIAAPSVFRPFDIDPLLHSSTFGANPLACAAVHAALSVIEHDEIAVQCRTLGQRLEPHLRELCAGNPSLFRTLSGRGAMWGIHCRHAHQAGLMIKHSLQRGLLLTPCLSTPAVIRLLPPAITSNEETEWAVGVLNAAAAQTDEESQLITGEQTVCQ